MDDKKYNDNDLAKIVEKAESLKSLLSDHKTAMPEADASGTTQAAADRAVSKETTAPKRPLHIPSASVHQASDKRQAVADLFAQAVDRSQKSRKELVEEAVTARVEKEKAALMQEHEARTEALRAETEAKIAEETQSREAVEKEMAAFKEAAEAKAQSEAEARADLEALRAETEAKIAEETQNREAVEKEMAAFKEATEAKAQSEAETRADLEAQLSEKDEQLSAMETEKQAAEEKAEAETKAWEMARAEAEARAKAQDEALAALRARLEENEARLAALEAERAKLANAAEETPADDADAFAIPESLQASPVATESAAEAIEKAPASAGIAADGRQKAVQAPKSAEPSDSWEDDEAGLFESESLPEETEEAAKSKAAAERMSQTAESPNVDLVTDHAAFRTHQPQDAVALSEDIPWISPSISEKRRERRLDWLEAEDQDETETPQAAEAPPAEAEPIDRKTEEDRDVLDVLRRLANAKPVQSETGVADTDAQSTDAAVADWLFEEDEILPETDTATESELFETEILPDEKAVETVESEASADVPAEPEKDDFWQAESEPATDAIETTEETPDFWETEAPEATGVVATSDQDDLWNDAAPASADVAEEASTKEKTADISARTDEIVEGFAIEDTQVLDSEAIDHFFAMSESDDEVPSILDEKAEEAQAEGAVNVAETKTEAAPEDFDDLFEDVETIETDAAAPAAEAADDLFESVEIEPEAADGLFDSAKDKAGETKTAAKDAFDDLFDESEADDELTKAIDRRAIHEKLKPSEQAVYDDLFSDDDADLPDEETAKKPRRRGLFGKKR
ncbi:putative cell envelope integrity inner membrane protein TolA [Pseudoramibacter alactolyticus ATCC 23263]|uniref:Putative cell envelope integrity inner membrane protein TolA n=1 Tax=Pseudoramibacter alactolyticus ATCC 23263 TaxID=887929 RepID=E6MI14_9FIRM|nr:hypothetical protein [Pseudoramibacter alactolyticus]EFV01338.1 putative cell envelope integrity inner membrane protein TolA [Pseudoramibacter alactolyticus ATCC 23263]